VYTRVDFVYTNTHVYELEKALRRIYICPDQFFVNQKYKDMKSMNKVQLIGWLGKDMEVRTAKNGKQYAKLRMSTEHMYENVEGQRKQATVWHTVWVWDNEIVESHKHYLISGSHIMVEGNIGYRVYTDAKGQFNNISEIRATCLIDLDR